MARPRKDIDADEVFKLAKRGCTQKEIAAHFGVAQSTISERFRSEFELGSAQSITSLRSWQFKRAYNGSDTMLIHLGKVYLNQTDKLDITSDGKGIQSSFERIDNNRDKEVSPPAEAKGVLPE